MKQLANETYEEFKLRRSAENDHTDDRLSPRLVWDSKKKGTLIRNMPLRIEKPKKATTPKERKRKRISGSAKRRAKGGMNDQSRKSATY